MVEEEDPDLLVLQLLAADQLGHVRGVRSPEYLDQLAETDRHVGDFLAVPRGARQARRRDRDPDGRPRPGPRHRRPRPPRLGRAAGAVRRLGRGCGAGRGLARAALGARAGRDDRAPARRAGSRRGGARPAARAGGGRAGGAARRGQPARAASRSWSRATRRPPSAACLRGIPSAACGLPWTCCSWTTARATRRPRSGASTARASHSHAALARPRAPPCAPASRSPATRATPPPSTSTATASTTPPTSRACSSPSRAAARTTCSARASWAARRHVLAPHAREPRRRARCSALHADGHERRPDRLPRASRPARSPPPASRHDYNYAQVLTLSLWGPGIDAGRGSDPLPAPHQRALVRALPGVPRASGAGGLARVARGARLAQDQRSTARHRSPPASQNGQPPPGSNSGSSVGERAERRVRPSRRRASRRPSARRRRARPTRRRVSAASTLPSRGMWRRPMATSGIASGSPASRWRGGNQKPNIVGATNAATTSCAPSAAAQSGGRQLDLAHVRARPAPAARDASATATTARRRPAGTPAPSAAARSRGR